MIKHIATMFLAFFVAIAMFMPEKVDAANCQGLSSGRCKSNSNCVWVSGYTRKGSRVKAYCRAKPTRSGVTKKRSTAKKKRVTKKRRVTKKKTTPKKRRVVKKRTASKKKTTTRRTRKKKKTE